MRTVLLALSSLLIAGCATVPAPREEEARHVGFVDLTDDFAAAYDGSAGLSEPERARAVRKAMQAAIPDLYDPQWRDVPEDRIDEWFAKYLSSYPAERAGIADVAARFNAMMDPGVADFERRLGTLPEGTPVYLVISLGEFDGATRSLAGRTHLLFGADMIATLHQGNDPQPLVQHELFHIYHDPRFTGCAEIWCSLWTEGLATYVAQQLNPGASDSELLLTVPEPIRPALESHRAEAVCATLARLDSRDGADRDALFSFSRLSENIPPRAGYLIGAWVAEDLGRTRSLAELAELDGDGLRSEIEASLAGMADCS